MGERRFNTRVTLYRVTSTRACVWVCVSVRVWLRGCEANKNASAEAWSVSTLHIVAAARESFHHYNWYILPSVERHRLDLLPNVTPPAVLAF